VSRPAFRIAAARRRAAEAKQALGAAAAAPFAVAALLAQDS
jgi:hypothetical protein